MKTHEAAAAKEAAEAANEAAKALPVGFISQDVKREREVKPLPAEPEKKPVMNPKGEEIPFGFIAEDVKKQHV